MRAIKMRLDDLQCTHQSEPKSGWRYDVDWNLMTHANWKVNTPMQQSVDLVTEAIIVYVIKHAITGKFFDFSFLKCGSKK